MRNSKTGWSTNDYIAIALVAVITILMSTSFFPQAIADMIH